MVSLKGNVALATQVKYVLDHAKCACHVKPEYLVIAIDVECIATPLYWTEIKRSITQGILLYLCSIDPLAINRRSR